MIIIVYGDDILCRIFCRKMAALEDVKSYEDCTRQNLHSSNDKRFKTLVVHVHSREDAEYAIGTVYTLETVFVMEVQ